MSKLQAVTAVCVSGALVFGLVLALLGSIKLSLAKRFDLGERRVAGLLSALNLTLIPMMLFSGVLIDQVGVRAVLTAGSVLTALAIFTLSRSPHYGRAVQAVLLLGMGAACVSVSTVVLMPRAFFDEPESVVLNVNLGYVFIALGALLSTVLADVLLRTLEFRRTVGVLAVLCLAPAVLCVTPLGRELFEEGQGGAPLALLNDDRRWLLLLAGLAFFFYAPLEGAVSVWTTTYLSELGEREGREAWLLGGFWTTFLGSRVLLAYLQLSDNWQRSLLVVLALLAAVMLGNLSATASRGSARFGLLFLGLVLGPIFPTLLGLLFGEMARNQHGAAYGLLFGVGSVGSLMLAPLVGERARRVSVRVAFRVPMIIALCMTAAVLVFVLMTGR